MIITSIAALGSASLLLWWITRPSNCPRCGDKHDPRRNAQYRADRATCSRCGCNFNPITGERV